MVPSQTFNDHIKELRRRIAWIVLAVAVSAVISYVIRVQVIRWLQKPLGATLFYTSPAGSFNFILKLSTIIGMFVALPVMIYQLLRFLEPAMPMRISKRLMTTVIGSSFVLALAGIAFGYFYMIPESLHFFAGYATAQIKPLISANEYLSYLINNLMVFAIVFQIPLIILFINRIKPLKPSNLLRYQRHVVVGSLALAVVLPFTYDPVSQFIIAIPIVVLYYLSAVLLWIANRRQAYPQVATNAVVVAPKPSSLPLPSTNVLSIPIPKIIPVLPAGRSMAIDGFVSQPADLVKPIQFYNTKEAPQPTNSVRSSIQSAPPRRTLSIDGIIPPLPSSI